MSGRRYAAGTSVTAQQTQGEIGKLLMRFQCDRIINAQEPGQHVIYFEIDGRGFKFSLPLPDPGEDRFVRHSRGIRAAAAAQEEYEKECNRRWRCFGALIKATLVAVEEEILPLHQALAPYAMLPNRQTVAESVAENMAKLGSSGPLALPWNGGGA